MLCRACHSMLPSPDTDVIVCRNCGQSTTWADVPPDALDRTVSSGQRQDPPWLLRRKKKHEDDKQQQQQQHATVEEPCPVCRHGEATFYTMQLRSADEGSTVFYECLKCKHKWNQDN